MPLKRIGGGSMPLQWLGFALIACLTLAGTLAGSSFARPRHGVESQRGQRSQKAEEPAPPAGPLFFVISTNNQHVSVYGPNGLYARSPVSTGRPDHPTPHGIFSIIGKERYHHSNIYSGAPMPYMQRITWSGVAMHEGVLPGYAASHGCVRMPHEFAKRLFGYTQGNERVVISHQEVVPASISHPNLFEPKLMEAPGSGNIASGSAQMLKNAISVSAQANGGAEKLDVAVKPDAADVKPAGSGQKLLNPFEFAKAMQARAAKQASEAAAALGPSRGAIEAKAREVREAIVAERKAQIALTNAKAQLESADRLAKNAPAVEDSAAAVKEQAAAKVAEAEAALSSAQRVKAEKQQDAANALKAYNEADNTRRAAADTVKSWNRRLAPLSIFVSRKTQRLYIRQGFIKVFDVPVTIREPEKPLGTHLYIAMPEQQGSPNAASQLRWLVITIPDASTGEEPERRRRRHSGEDTDAPRAVAAASASQALDRIEVPAEVREKVSEMLWAGSSLVVSDKAMSGETGDHTDFVILTR